MTRRLASFSVNWLIVLVLAFASLSGCAAGTPGVAQDSAANTNQSGQVASVQELGSVGTATATVRVAVTATATDRPTKTPPPEPTNEPTATPTETPEPGPTARPDPPEDDGSGLSQVFDRSTSGRDEVALTFDAGADRGYAEEILETLAEYGVKASFGITGHWADENPDLLERMVAEGHMVFNHTWTHRSFTGYSTADWDEGVLATDERSKELRDTEEIIAELTDGYETAPYFRPPYGDLDDSMLTDVAAEGYWVTVMWTCDSFGWNGASVDEIVERCGAQADAGDIILMHVGAESLDAEALPLLIETLEDAGFELVTVEELLQP